MLSPPLTSMVPPLLNDPKLAATLWMTAELLKVTLVPVIVMSPPFPAVGNSKESVLVSMVASPCRVPLIMIVGAVIVTEPEFPGVKAVCVSIPELVRDTLDVAVIVVAPPLPPPKVPVNIPLSIRVSDGAVILIAPPFPLENVSVTRNERVRLTLSVAVSETAPPSLAVVPSDSALASTKVSSMLTFDAFTVIAPAFPLEKNELVSMVVKFMKEALLVEEMVTAPPCPALSNAGPVRICAPLATNCPPRMEMVRRYRCHLRTRDRHRRNDRALFKRDIPQ